MSVCEESMPRGGWDVGCIAEMLPEIAFQGAVACGAA